MKPTARELIAAHPPDGTADMIKVVAQADTTNKRKSIVGLIIAAILKTIRFTHESVKTENCRSVTRWIDRAPGASLGI